MLRPLLACTVLVLGLFAAACGGETSGTTTVEATAPQGTDTGSTDGTDGEVEERVVLEDDFSSNETGWNEGQLENFGGMAMYDGSEYFVLASNKPDQYVHSRNEELGDEIGDVRIEGSVEYFADTDPEENIAAGFGCRVDGETEIVALVHPDGAWEIYRAEGDDVTALEDGSVEGDFDPEEAHEMALECVGQEITLEIDGEEVGSTEDEDAPEEGAVEMHLDSLSDGNGAAMFDDVTVTVLDDSDVDAIEVDEDEESTDSTDSADE